MYKKRKLIRVFSNNPQGRRLRGRPKNIMVETCTNRY